MQTLAIEDNRSRRKENEMLNLVAGVLVVAGALKLLHYLNKKQKQHDLQPYVQLCGDGLHVEKFERFGNYVVRQLELCPDTTVARTLAKMAEDYLRGDKSSSDRSRENVCILVSGPIDQKSNEELEHLHSELLKEIDACMVAYFSFHWKHASAIIDQVVSNGVEQKRLRKAVWLATRPQRIERVLKCLKTKRRFVTLVEQLKAMNSQHRVQKQNYIMVPAHPSVRSPVLLFIGGGMGAGKSTVVQEHILKSAFWSGVAHNAVIVEADAFKETDVIYRTLNAMGQDDVASTAELVHQFSTEAALSVLVAALNEGRDVIFDGTMQWEPFVLQTVAMARDVHRRRYRMGPGYCEGEFERYWEPVPEELDVTPKVKEGQLAVDELPSPVGHKNNGTIFDAGGSVSKERKPYRIEFVGVTCDAHLAVVRGMRRAILTKRGVPVKGQLWSHKLFAKSLDKYITLMDSVKIYSTSNMYGHPELIGLKDEPDTKILVDCSEFNEVQHMAKLNPDAGSVLELYSEKCCQGSCNQMWQDLVVAGDRERRQALLRSAFQSLGNDMFLHKSDSESSLHSEGSLTSSSCSPSPSNGHIQ
ncbi:unnamed protein product [Sphagnum troendelagicum]|uniref:Zeta toxin domain-containing protein n=1 Tax=Sphagnum troendelagicum TaxID=128251 RepID=A0ABP0V565_9BRYO